MTAGLPPGGAARRRGDAERPPRPRAQRALRLIERIEAVEDFRTVLDHWETICERLDLVGTNSHELGRRLAARS